MIKVIIIYDTGKHSLTIENKNNYSFQLFCTNLYKEGGFLIGNDWIPYHRVTLICLDD